jgi:hypothetical protein
MAGTIILEGRVKAGRADVAGALVELVDGWRSVVASAPTLANGGYRIALAPELEPSTGHSEPDRADAQHI